MEEMRTQENMEKVKKNEVIKKIAIVSTAVLCGAMTCGNSITASAFNHNDRQQNERMMQLVDQGYDWQVASDQVDEEMLGIDGAYGDGMLIVQTP